jgi:predicted nucleic acid-binding protein
MNVYADSSFFVPLYLHDARTPEVLRRIGKGPKIWLTDFHELEFSHAIEQKIHRGEINRTTAERIYQHLDGDRKTGLWLRAPFSPEVFHKGTQLAHRWVSVLGGRTLDTLHVAWALDLGAREFWTFDERQAKLAKAVGLKVV